MLIRPYSVLLLFLTLSSCVTIYFNQPQPVDAKNLRKAPCTIQGTWVIDLDTVIIGKHSFYWAQWLIDTVPAIEVDTNTSLEVRNGRIYDLSEEPPVSYKYTPLSDSFMVFIPDRIYYELADTALLRKVSTDFYSFNLTKDRIWWEVFLVERTGKGDLSIWYPGKTDVCLMEATGAGTEQYLPEDGDPSTAFTNDFQKYWYVEMTKEKLMECFDLGAFGELILELNARPRK